jgi:peptidoglycan/LPS O-acetylase OafA/YrhL
MIDAKPDTRPVEGFGYIPGLDGIRAISIALVMVAHYGFGNIVPGGLGVTIFFFLSGFLITGLLLKEQDTSGLISVPNFYARRFLRLTPELLLLIVVGFTIGRFVVPLRIVDGVTALTYTTNYFTLYNEAFVGADIRWPHLWSLAVEEHFYLTFPLIVVFLGKTPKLLLSFLITVCLAALMWRLYIVAYSAPFGFLQSGTVNPYTYVATDCRFDSIAYGCLTAVLFAKFPMPLKHNWMAWSAVVAAALLMLISLIFRGEDFRETYRYSLQGIAMILLFYGLFGTGTSMLTTILEAPILRKMGVLSYGAYLCHMEPVIIYSRLTGASIHEADVMTRTAMVIGGFILTFIAAELSYNFTRKVRGLRSRFGATVAHG